MDADTKHVLFVSQGKSMDVVTRFLEFVGRLKLEIYSLFVVAKSIA